MSRNHAQVHQEMPKPLAVGSRTLPGWLVAFATAALLYGVTAARVIQWQDSGYHVLRVVRGEVLNPLGLALSHPLHHWLGRAVAAIVPAEPAFSFSLLSGVAAAITVANVFGIVRQLSGRTLPAILAAFALAVAHTFWKLATIPETYTLATALLTAEMWAIVRWAQTRRPTWLILVFFASGLGLANHNLALLALPVTGIVLLAALKQREVGIRTLHACGAVWVIGASPILILVISRAIETGQPLAAIRSALFGDFQSNVLGVGLTLRATAISLAFTLLSFPNLTLPAAVYGIAKARAVGVPAVARRALLAALLIHLVFVLRYNVIDQYMFLLPAYALLAIFSGVGFAAIVQLWTARAARRTAIIGLVLAVTTPVLYCVLPTIARQMNVLASQDRKKPYRDDYAYFFYPWGVAEISADRMSHAAIEFAAPRGLVVVEDDMGLFAVEYRRLIDAVGDVRVVAPVDVDEAAIRAALRDKRTVVWVPMRRDDPPPRIDVGWIRVGHFYVAAEVPAKSQPAPDHTSRRLLSVHGPGTPPVRSRWPTSPR